MLDEIGATATVKDGNLVIDRASLAGAVQSLTHSGEQGFKGVTCAIMLDDRGYRLNDPSSLKECADVGSGGRNGLIVFWGGDQKSNPQIYVMNPDGTGIANLSRSDAFDALPRWSPDGTKIVFSRSVGTAPLNLYRMNADGSTVVRLTNHPDTVDAFAAWTADGRRIVFTRAPSGATGAGCAAGATI